MQPYLCVFPGQGSQSVGMLSEWAAIAPEVKATFDEASDALGYDAWHLSQQGPLTSLNQTEKTQPLLLAAGVAMWRIWSTRMPAPPVAMAGHSLGEYTALVCAGSLPFEQALRLVAYRGACMQNAVGPDQGAMAAILGLSVDQVNALCASCAQGDSLSAANYNAPDQVVIAGTKEAITRAVQAAKAAGGRAIVLPVSVPSHCPLMAPAAAQVEAYLADQRFNLPQYTVYHNVDLSQATPAGIRAALVAQLHQPVRWMDTIQALAKQGIETILECGPGNVLTGLAKRIHPSGVAIALGTPTGLDKALACLEGKTAC